MPIHGPVYRPVGDGSEVEPAPEVADWARRGVGAVGDTDLAAGGLLVAYGTTKRAPMRPPGVPAPGEWGPA